MHACIITAITAMKKQHKKLKMVMTPSFPKSYTRTNSDNDGCVMKWEPLPSVCPTVRLNAS